MFWKTLRDYTEPFKSSHEARKVLLRLSYKENTPEDIEHTLSYLMGERPIEVYSIALDLLRAHHMPPKNRYRPLEIRRESLQRAVVEGVENMVRSAARYSLIYPPLGVWTVKMNLGWEDYLNLRAYRRRCGLKLFELLAVGRVVENMGTEWIWYDTKCGVCPFIYEWAVLIYSEYGILKYPAEWWMTYWGKAITLAGETPCEEEVLNREGIWDRVSQELKLKCPTCYEAVQKEYPRFRDELSSKVTKIINNVKLQIKLWP